MFCCRRCLKINNIVVPSNELQHVEKDSPQIHSRPAWEGDDEPLQEHMSGAASTNSSNRSWDNDGDPSCINGRSSCDKRSVDSDCDPSQLSNSSHTDNSCDPLRLSTNLPLINDIEIATAKHPRAFPPEAAMTNADRSQDKGRSTWDSNHEPAQEHLSGFASTNSSDRSCDNDGDTAHISGRSPCNRNSMDNDCDPSQLSSSSHTDISCDSLQLSANLPSMKDIGTTTAKHPIAVPPEAAVTNADRSQDNNVNLHFHGRSTWDSNHKPPQEHLVETSEAVLTNSDRSPDSDGDGDISHINGRSPCNRSTMDNDCDSSQLSSSSHTDIGCDSLQLSVHLPSMKDIEMATAKHPIAVPPEAAVTNADRSQDNDVNLHFHGRSTWDSNHDPPQKDSPQIHSGPAWEGDDEPLQEHLSGAASTNSSERSWDNDGDPFYINGRSPCDSRSMDSDCDPSQEHLMETSEAVLTNSDRSLDSDGDTPHINGRSPCDKSSVDNDCDQSQLSSSSHTDISGDSLQRSANLPSMKDIRTATAKHRRAVPPEAAMTNADRAQDNDVNLHFHGRSTWDSNHDPPQEHLMETSEAASPLNRRPVDSDCDPPRLISNNSADRDCGPPQLCANIPSMSDIEIIIKQPQLPVDILLLTVENYEFLACYQELKDPYRCWFDGLGYVYFAADVDVDERQEEKVKVALMRCFRGGTAPGGSLIMVKNAVTVLRPKAVISVGSCSGLIPEKTKLGDVVVSAKLTTYAPKVVTRYQEQSTGMRSYVSRRFLDIIKNCADGWQAPLKNPEAREVNVHSDAEFLSGPEQVSAEWRRKQLAELHPQATAVEMEGEGIFTAAFDCQIEWLIVKGIADYADGTRLTEESWCPCASVMAASLVTHILSDSDVFRTWPHYKAPVVAPFDLKRCQDQLHTFYNTLSQVRITPWNPDDTVHIDEVYTNLSWQRDHKTPRRTRHKKLKEYSELFEGNKRFPNPKRILVCGRPGIGKSTFSKKVAFDWTTGRKEILKKFKVLLMIKLRDVGGLQDFGAVLQAAKVLGADGTISVDSLSNFILENQNQVLLVLDGYDEYTAGDSSLVDQIWERDLLRDCHVIMTMRPAGADKVRKSSDVQLQIRGFDSKEQVQEFASKYLTDSQEVEELLRYLSTEEIWDIAEIPLLLLMMCLVWRERHNRGLPKSKLELYERFVATLIYQMAVKDSDKKLESNVLESYKEELSEIGRLALDSLLQGTLYFPLKRLNTQSNALSKTMIRAGLFQISKLSSADPNESVFFLHKSIQEFVAAWFIMHEAGLKEGSTACLSSIDSLNKVLKVEEILSFMCQWSEEGAKAVFSLLQFVREKEGLTKYNFTEVLTFDDLSQDQIRFCTTCLDYLLSCSALHRQAVYPLFLNCVHGVVLFSSSQRPSIASEHVLKSSNLSKPDYVLYLPDEGYDPYELFSIMCDLETVIVTCFGDTKSVDKSVDKNEHFHTNYFTIKKEGQQMIFYLTSICSGLLAPRDLLSVLTSAPQSPKKPVDHVLQNQDASSSLNLTEKTSDQSLKNSLSFLRLIFFDDRFFPMLIENHVIINLHLVPRLTQLIIVNAEVGDEWCRELATSLKHVVKLQVLRLNGNPLGHGIIALGRHLHSVPHLIELKLEKTQMSEEEVTAVARGLQSVPHLEKLHLSCNPLGHGINKLAEHLHSVPHLTELNLEDTQMGKEEVTAVARSLQSVPHLKILSLSCNPLGHGINKLAEHLHSVPHLTKLNLYDTQMGKEEVTAVARALKYVPELKTLCLFRNPLGRGVSELIQHLSSIPQLGALSLFDVQMTKNEACELCSTVRGTNIYLSTDYHIRDNIYGEYRVRTDAELQKISRNLEKSIEFDEE